jgi:hypothetical protein
MKRLLLGPAIIAIPLALFGCNWGVKAPEVPKVPTEIVRQIPLEDFEHFPPVVAAPVEPARKPVVRHKPAPHHPATRKPKAPVEPLPPQQGPICIFPLNMIPNCKPQEIR